MSKANDFPVVPEHIEPGKEGSLTRLPAALVIDYALNIERLKGILVITFKDEAGLLYERKQELTIWKQVDDATDVKYIMTVGGEIVAEKSGIISMFKKKFWRRR